MTSRERFAYLVNQAVQHAATTAELEELCELMKTEDIPPQLLPDAPPVAYDAAHWDNIASNILAADQLPAKENIIPMRAKRR